MSCWEVSKGFLTAIAYRIINDKSTPGPGHRDKIDFFDNLLSVEDFVRHEIDVNSKAFCLFCNSPLDVKKRIDQKFADNHLSNSHHYLRTINGDALYEAVKARVSINMPDPMRWNQVISLFGSSGSQFNSKFSKWRINSGKKESKLNLWKMFECYINEKAIPRLETMTQSELPETERYTNNNTGNFKNHQDMYQTIKKFIKMYSNTKSTHMSVAIIQGYATPTLWAIATTLVIRNDIGFFFKMPLDFCLTTNKQNEDSWCNSILKHLKQIEEKLEYCVVQVFELADKKLNMKGYKIIDASKEDIIYSSDIFWTTYKEMKGVISKLNQIKLSTNKTSLLDILTMISSKVSEIGLKSIDDQYVHIAKWSLVLLEEQKQFLENFEKNSCPLSDQIYKFANILHLFSIVFGKEDGFKPTQYGWELIMNPIYLGLCIIGSLRSKKGKLNSLDEVWFLKKKGYMNAASMPLEQEIDDSDWQNAIYNPNSTVEDSQIFQLLECFIQPNLECFEWLLPLLKDCKNDAIHTQDQFAMAFLEFIKSAENLKAF